MRSFYGLGLGSILATAFTLFPPMPMIPLAPEPRRGSSKRRRIGTSKYMPHQGKRECARRRRQLASRAGEAEE